MDLFERASEEIKKEVLSRITPSKEDHDAMFQKIDRLIVLVKEQLKSCSVSADVELVGSTAKGTYLVGNMDVDVFLVFDRSVKRSVLATTALSIGRSLLSDTEECYAEHPYIRGVFEGLKCEIVPCYRIGSADELVSAVDRTPLHTSYVLEHLSLKQRDEVRLLKQFLKGIGCYGAEAEVEGFSGYLCEILILRFGSFDNVLLDAMSWSEKVKLSLSDESFSGFDGPLIFIDPVDSNRNVASALSVHRFEVFVKAACEYVKKPLLSFFFPSEVVPWSCEKILSELGSFCVVGLCFPKPSDLIAENLYPQVRKSLKSIVELAERFDFVVDDSLYAIGDDTVYLILFVDETVLSKTRIHVGPPVAVEKNATDFKKKWQQDERTVRGPWVEDGRLFVEIKREYQDISSLLKNEVVVASLGKDLDAVIREKMMVCSMKDLVVEDLRRFWTLVLDDRFSWER